MKINLSPVRMDKTLSIVKQGDALKINGELFDFSQMVDGDILPADAISSEWFVGSVYKIGNSLELTLILPLPINYSQAQAFPEPLTNLWNGEVKLPQPLPIEKDLEE